MTLIEKGSLLLVFMRVVATAESLHAGFYYSPDSLKGEIHSGGQRPVDSVL